MTESRIAPRSRIFKAGTVSFGGGAIDCTVRSISKTGASIEVVTPLFIPDRFTLVIPSDQFQRHVVCLADGAANGIVLRLRWPQSVGPFDNHNFLLIF